MLFIMHPEITITGKDQKEILRKTMAVTAILRSLKDVDEVDMDVGDDQYLTQHDPDPDVPMSPDLRAEVEEALVENFRTFMFGDGLEKDYILGGVKMVGLQEMTEQALLEVAAENIDPSSDLYLKLLTHFAHRSISIQELDDPR